MSSLVEGLKRAHKALGYACDRGLYFRKYMTVEEREAVAAEEIDVIQAYRSLPGLIQRAEEIESSGHAPPSVYATYRRVVDYLRTIPAHHVPRSYLTHHADPMRRGKDETAIEVAFHLNDTSDATMPPQTRFDAITMKFMLVGGRFVRTTPKELPEMSSEAREIVRRVEEIVITEKHPLTPEAEPCS